jgi:lipopolysaccharide transport system permease protein
MRAADFLLLTLFKVRANLRSELSRDYLNYLWWIVEPILFMGVYYLVFGILLKQGTHNFVPFLLIGLTSWQWFSNALIHSSTSIFNAQGIMRQIKINKIFFPLVTVLQDTVKNLIVFSLLLLFCVIYGLPVTLNWLALPILLAVQLIIFSGCCIMFSGIVPFFPDLRFVLNSGLFLLMCLSGVFFDVDTTFIPRHSIIIYMNPMAGLLKNYRLVLLHGQPPEWGYLLIVGFGGLLLLGLAAWLVNRLDHLYLRAIQ